MAGPGAAAVVRAEAGVQRALLALLAASAFLVGARLVLCAEFAQRSNPKVPREAAQLPSPAPAHGA